MDLDQSPEAEQLQSYLLPSDAGGGSSQPDAAPDVSGPAAGASDNPLLASLPSGDMSGGAADVNGAAPAGESSPTAGKTADGTIDMAGQIGTWADMAVSTAEAAGKEMGVLGKAMPGIGTVLSGISAVNDVRNALTTDDPQAKNMAWAKAAYDGASMIPGVGTVLGVADNIVGKGLGKAIGWDDEKEGGSMMTYGTERTMESLGILNHADTASEKASKAAAHDMVQEEARGAPAANPINPIAPDPFAPNDPLAVPPGYPRPPGM